MNKNLTCAASVVAAASAVVGADCTEVQTSLARTEDTDAVAVAQNAADAEGKCEVRAAREYDLNGSRFFSCGIKRPGAAERLRCLTGRFPSVVLSADFQSVTIKELGLVLPSSGFNQEKLERLIWREFLSLENRAKADRLLDEDRKKWLVWTEFLDYAKFREDTAPLVRTVGELVGFGDDFADVRWHGSAGGLERIYGENAEKLAIVSAGEWFSALTRFVDFKISQIEDVRPEDVQAGSDSEDDLSWIV